MKIRKFLSLMLVLTTVLSLCAVFAGGASAATSWDGKTSNIKWYVDDPTSTTYSIKSAEELYGISLIIHYGVVSHTNDTKVYYDENYNVITDKTQVIAGTTPSVAWSAFAGVTFNLEADIDLGGKVFIPIGASYGFGGSFDGKNHTIKNLYVNAETSRHMTIASNQYYGLFATTYNNGEIKDLNLENVVFDVELQANGQHVMVGAISADNMGTKITNCSINGVTIDLDSADDVTTTQTFHVGAVIGRLRTGLEQSNVTVTNFELNVADGCPEYMIDTSKVYGATLNVVANVANCSVQDKPADSGDIGNPDTSDFTVCVALLAFASAITIAFVAKKRHS